MKRASTNGAYSVIYETHQERFILHIAEDGIGRNTTEFSYAGIDYEHASYWLCKTCGEVVQITSELEHGSMTDHARAHYDNLIGEAQ